MGCAKFRENYSGIIMGIIAAIIIWWLNPKYSSCIPFICAIPQLTSCIFGFLLALLGIILQGESPTIVAMKARTRVYNRFILFNKKIVYLSLILSVITLVIGYVDFLSFGVSLIDISLCVKDFITSVIISLVTFGMVWLFIDLLTFLKLFYLLITAKENKGDNNITQKKCCLFRRS